MKKIGDSTKSRAKSISLRLTLWLGAGLLLVFFAGLWWNTSRQLTAAAFAVSGSLTYALQNNDSVSTQIALVSLSRVADHYCLQFEKQKSLCSGPELKAPKLLNLYIFEGWPHLLQTTPIYNSQLSLSKRLPLEYLFFVLSISILIYVFLRFRLHVFAKRLAHDIASPLQLLAYSLGQSVQFDDFTKNKKLRESLKYKEVENVLDEVVGLLEGINDKQDLSSAYNRERSEEESHHVDINKICDSLLTEKRNRYELPADFSLKLFSTLSYPVTIDIDSVELTQKLSQMLDQAIKGTDRIHGSIEVHIEENNDSVNIHVATSESQQQTNPNIQYLKLKVQG